MTNMAFVIKEAVTEQELNGKASVHFISWKESYADLVPRAFWRSTAWNDAGQWPLLIQKHICCHGER